MAAHLLATGYEDREPVRAVREWWRKRQRLMILSGPSQVGKTTAGCAWILGEVRRGNKSMYYLRANVDLPGIDLVRKLERAERIERAEGVVLDDLGTETLDAKGFFLSKLDWIVCRRYDHGSPTLITTNLSAADFRARYDEPRILERVRRDGTFYEVSNGAETPRVRR